MDLSQYPLIWEYMQPELLLFGSNGTPFLYRPVCFTSLSRQMVFGDSLHTACCRYCHKLHTRD